MCGFGSEMKGNKEPVSTGTARATVFAYTVPQTVEVVQANGTGNQVVNTPERVPGDAPAGLHV